MQTDTIGVILLNMGGPARLEDVGPFLFKLFSDRDIIRLGPAFLQKPLAWLIARRRAPRSRLLYEKIGGGSPLGRITLAQQQALQAALGQDGDFVTATAMRYWHPTTQTALAELARHRLGTIVALSLYPHYSRATSGSSLNELKRHLRRGAGHPPILREVTSWPDHPGYLACLAKRITDGLRKFDGAPVEIVYSAHSLPVSFIRKGDPYVTHLNLTINGVQRLTGHSGSLCYQSRSGPVEWLSPSTPEMIGRLAESGCRNILMVPISFVSDHVETLYEINIQYKEMAANLGIRLEATESLNTDPEFIAVLRDLVLNALAAGG